MDTVSIGKSLHKGGYRPDVDGLRAIAVSSVVVSHAFPSRLPGGFIGVDVFFVISGYLITTILIKDFDQNAFSIWKFYDRRVRRIFPALVAVLLAILALGWFCMTRPEYAELGKHIAASALFSENFLLWSEVSYFDIASALKPTLHLWSLAVEEQFYIAWPIILYAAHRLRLHFGVIFIGFACLSFFINLHEIHSDPTAAYYSPAGRSWELMVGSALAYIQQHRPQLVARFRNLQSVVGLALIGVALITIRPAFAFPGFWALMPTAGAFLLIACGEGGWVNRHVLAQTPMVWCGLISYPLYLWHWFFLSYANILLPNVTVAAKLLCIAASVLMATLTFLFIERPLRTRRTGGAPVAILCSMVAVLGLAGLSLTQVLPPRLRDLDGPTANEWSFLDGLAGTSASRSAGIEPNNDEVNFYALGGNRPAQVLLIGDSHLAQYAQRLNQDIAGHPDRPAAVLALGGGCIPLAGTSTDDGERAACWPMRDQAYRLADDPRIKRIVIGGAWNWYLLASGYYYQAGGHRLALNYDAGRQAAFDHLAERVKAWQLAGKEVIFVLDNPISPLLPFVGWQVRLNLNTRTLPANRTIRITDDQAGLRRQLLAWAASIGVPVIDPFGAVCTGTTCRTTSESGQPLYRDAAHFNPDWALAHASFIDAAVSDIR